jgi:hypothetical protein
MCEVIETSRSEDIRQSGKHHGVNQLGVKAIVLEPV